MTTLFRINYLLPLIIELDPSLSHDQVRVQTCNMEIVSALLNCHYLVTNSLAHKPFAIAVRK